MTHKFTLFLSVSAVAIGAIFAVNGFILAWTSPSASPPDDNAPAPLNVSATGQSKAGGLILNTGGAVTGLIVDQGNVGIGTTSPTEKLDVDGNINIDEDSAYLFDGANGLKLWRG